MKPPTLSITVSGRPLAVQRKADPLGMMLWVLLNLGLAMLLIQEMTKPPHPTG